MARGAAGLFVWLSLKLIYEVPDLDTTDDAGVRRLAVATLLPPVVLSLGVFVISLALVAITRSSRRRTTMRELFIPVSTAAVFLLLLCLAVLPWARLDEVQPLVIMVDEDWGSPGQVLLTITAAAYSWLFSVLWLVAVTIPFHTFRAADGHLFLAPLVAIWTAWMVGWIADLIGALSVDDYILNRTALSGPIKLLCRLRRPGYRHRDRARRDALPAPDIRSHARGVDRCFPQ